MGVPAGRLAASSINLEKVHLVRPREWAYCQCFLAKPLTNFLPQFPQLIEVSINWRYSLVITDTLDQPEPELVLPFSTLSQFL